MDIKIKLYEDKYFNKLCAVMDKARMQELESENLQDVFISLTKAPYQNYLLSCKIYIAVKNEELLGFVGFKDSNSEFIYVDPSKQKQGVATKLLAKALNEMVRPIYLEVFSNNKGAKALYENFGFRTIKTVIEKWSVEYPVEFSQDTMELR